MAHASQQDYVDIKLEKESEVSRATFDDTRNDDADHNDRMERSIFTHRLPVLP